MNPRRDGGVVIALVVALGGLLGGMRWLALIGAVVGWGVLLWAVRPPMPSAFRTAVHGAMIAMVIAGAISVLLIRGGFYFYLHPEWKGVSLSFASEGIRGILFGICLYLYARLRVKWGIPTSALATGVMAFVLGLLFEQIGIYRQFWEWNVLSVPNWQLGSAWMFVPVAWGVTFLFSGYYLLPFQHRIAQTFQPVIVGIRCGAAFGALWLISWTMFVRLLGKAQAI